MQPRNNRGLCSLTNIGDAPDELVFLENRKGNCSPFHLIEWVGFFKENFPNTPEFTVL